MYNKLLAALPVLVFNLAFLVGCGDTQQSAVASTKPAAAPQSASAPIAAYAPNYAPLNPH